MTTFCRRITRRIDKKMPTKDGRGFMTVPDGSESAYIEMEVDIDRLLNYLGEKAMRNCSNKAVGLRGMLVARATKRERTPQPPPLSEEEKQAARALNQRLSKAMRDFL